MDSARDLLVLNHIYAQLVILALASYRLQRLVTSDSWYPFQWWRTFLYRKAQPTIQKSRQNVWTELAELFSCPHCFGLWTAAAVFTEHFVFNWIPMIVYAIFAAAAVVSWLAEQEDA